VFLGVGFLIANNQDVLMAGCTGQMTASMDNSGVLQCVAMCCNVLQRVTMCFSVLQCVAVCCGVLRCVAVCR